MHTAQGIIDQRIHGRKRPQRVRVRSATKPIIGSKKASQSRAMSTSQLASAARMPIASV